MQHYEFSTTVNQEFQDAKNEGEKTREEKVHIFLKNLPSTKFFFLYLIGHNVDYISLKNIVQNISELVSVCYIIFTVFVKEDVSFKNEKPPGYRTTMKNRMTSQTSSISQLKFHLSSTPAGSAPSTPSVTPARYHQQESVLSNISTSSFINARNTRLSSFSAPPYAH